MEPVGETVQNCPVKVDLYLDTAGVETTAMDIRVFSDETLFDLNGFDGQGGIFRSYTAPRITEIAAGSQKGKKTIYILASTVSRQGINKSGKIGTLTVTPKSWVTSLPLNYFMVPGVDTEDSNVAAFGTGGVYDALTSASGLVLNLKAWPCTTEKPTEVITLADNTGVKIEQNTEYVPQFADAEKKDQMGAWIALNFNKLLAGALILLVVVGWMIRWRIKSSKKIS